MIKRAPFRRSLSVFRVVSYFFISRYDIFCNFASAWCVAVKGARQITLNDYVDQRNARRDN